MASVAVDAWLAEGERLLDLCSSATDDQRAAVSAALQDAAAVMRCTKSARRSGSAALDSLPADIVDKALMFLDADGLHTLGAALNAALQRRHLMVWAIFAPRFVFAASLQAVSVLGSQLLWAHVVWNA